MIIVFVDFECFVITYCEISLETKKRNHKGNMHTMKQRLWSQYVTQQKVADIFMECVHGPVEPDFNVR